MHEKEKRILEERLLEANRKNLKGLEGKFGMILKNMGQQIVSESGGRIDSTPWPNFYDFEDEEVMPTMDEDGTITRIGWVFDGLSKGLHLEIKYMSEEKDLKVYYKGYQVYGEISEELVCYVPSDEWEKHVDGLYEVAKRIEGVNKTKQKTESEIEAKRKKQSFINKLRTRWGF